MLFWFLMFVAAGAAIFVWIWLWTRERRNWGTRLDVEQILRGVPGAETTDAVLVAREHGQLIHANDLARRWLNLGGGEPNLEVIANQVQPADSFRELFITERQSSFQIGSRWVQAASHRIPVGSEIQTVVMLRELKGLTDGDESLNLSQVMQIINEIGDTLNASMGATQMAQALLSILAKTIPADAGEIALWDDDARLLRQTAWIGDTAYLLKLAEAGSTYRMGEGIAGWVAQHRRPLLIEDRSDPSAIQPKLSANPHQCFLCVPLLLGDKFFGTLTYMGMRRGMFKQGDLALMQAVSTPIATSLYNAQLYAQQTQRVSDIASLQQVSERHKIENPESAAPVYAALTERIAKLMGATICGVYLYDENRSALIPEAQFYGLAPQLVVNLTIPLTAQSVQADLWQNQEAYYANDKLSDEPLIQATNLRLLVNAATIFNIALIPLSVGGRRIGMLHVSNKRSEGGFTAQNIQHLRVLASQAAIVVENLRLLRREQLIESEINALQNITQAIGTLGNQGDFYTDITQRVAQLMGVEMCGVLFYDRGSERLLPQQPFYGVENAVLRDYSINVRAGTVMEEIWSADDSLIINNVEANVLVFEAGLAELAEKLGVKKTLFHTLSASGQRFGVMQVSNKSNQHDFTDYDVRLMSIFAAQIAAMIENKRLLTQLSQSAETANALRRIAELSGSVVTTQEPFTPVLNEIGRLMRSPLVFINVLDQQTGSLITYPRWVVGIELTEPVVQDMFSAGFENSPAVSHEPFFTNDLRGNVEAGAYVYLSNKLGVINTIIVPLFVGDRSLGELGVANRSDTAYTDNDVELLTTLAAQIAAAIDRLRMYEATGINLNRRMEELDAISNISNVLTQTIELDKVLDSIRIEAARATNADGATIALLLPMSRWVSDDQPEVLRRIGLPMTGMAQLTDIERAAVLRGADTVMVTDYEHHQFKPLPLGVRSAVAAPFQYGEQVVGVLHIYHSEANRFDDRAAAFLLTVASKASLAYANDMRYQQQMDASMRLRQRVEQLNQIFELSQMLQTNADPVSVMEAISFSIHQSAGYEIVVILLYDEEAGVFKRVAQAGLPLPKFEESRQYTITQAQVKELFKPQFQISESYFFPTDKFVQWMIEDGMEALATSYSGIRTLVVFGQDEWHDGDKLIVPMMGATGSVLGMICLDRPASSKRPDRSSVEVLEIFAHQAASTVENTRLYLAQRDSAEQEARLNEMMEAVAATLDVHEIVTSVARGALRLLPFTRMTFALLDTEQQGFDVLRVNVELDGSINIVSDRRVDLERTALGQTFNTGEDHLYHKDDPKGAAFQDLEAWQARGEQTTLVLPLLAGGVCLGAAQVGSDLAHAFGFEEFRPLLKRMMNLAAIAVQNARLFNQAVNLRSLNESVIESIQQGIVVLDNSGRIVSVNDYMRQLYGWDDTALRRDLFAYSPELTRAISEDVKAVLETGEPRQQIRQPASDLAGNPTLRSYYSYPLITADAVRGVVLLVEDESERARLEADVESRAHQLSALTDVSSRITASLDRTEVVELAMQEMDQIIPFDTMSLWRRNGSFMVLEGVRGEGEEAVLPEMRFRISENERINAVVEQQRVFSNRGLTTALPNLDQPLPGERTARSWMGVPLVNQGHVVGLIVLYKNEPNFYESKDEQSAMAFANQVAVALANADLFEQTFARTNELGMLLEAAQATSQTLDLNEVFNTVVDLMLNTLDMDDCAIMIWDKISDSLEVQIDVNRDGDEERTMPKGTRYPLDKYPARRFALNERQVVVVRVDDPEGEPTELEALKQSRATARMLVPLVVRDESRGLIQVEQYSGDKPLTQQQIRLARALGSQVAVAIENARLSAETAERFEELYVINELSRVISSTLELDDVVQIVREQVPAVIGVDELYLALYDEGASEITFPLSIREGADYPLPPRELGSDEVSYIIKKKQMLILVEESLSLNDIRRNMRIDNGEGEVKSYMGVPLISGDKVIGVLAVRDSQQPRAFGVNDQGILTTVASQLGAAIQNARLYQQISNFAEDLERQVRDRTSELEQERDRIDTLFQITAELSRTLDMDRVLNRALGMVSKAVEADDGAIFLIDPMADQLYCRAALNSANLITGSNGDRPGHPAQAIAKWLLDNEEHELVLNDLSKVDWWDSSAPNAAKWNSALGVVLESEDVQGVMVFLSTDRDLFGESHLKLTVAAGSQVASSLNNSELYQMIQDQAERLGMLLRGEQEEAQKNAAILESIADGVMLTDATGAIILFNTSAERILELPRDQVIGQPLTKLTGLYGASAAAWTRSIEQWMANPDQQQERGGFLDERLSLGERVVSVHLSPVYITTSAGPSFLGTVSVFRDITKDVEVDRVKSEFISNVSHEFRTPMTSIKGYADLLLLGAGGDVDDVQKRFLMTIKENADRLSILVNDVLEISKLDSGRDALNIEPVDIQGVIDQVVANLQGRMEARNKELNVRTHIAPDLATLYADREKLLRVLMNLADNAFNYTYANGTIELNVVPDGLDRILFSIKDTGIGIPDDFKPRVWRRFERYEEHALVMDVAGTGLGLSIVKDLVEMHGGRIWFDSELGKGTTFFVSLPLSQPQAIKAN